MSKKSMASDEKNQQLSFFNFPAESKPIVQPPPRKSKSRGKVKHKMPAAIYTYQFTSNTPTLSADCVPTSRARDFVGVKKMMAGQVYERPTSYGGKWIVAWAGINPDDRRGYLWDIHLEQAS